MPKQLKGKVKESSKEKRQRKKEFQELQKQIFTIVLPTLAVVAACIVVYVYYKTKA
ncbi:single-pass membrane and coiled-coil domain-containing protein 4 [Cylas formicarius]|uniref:single-pass membrane and coiled-coil domain-containing protein 4 n=1 Tax=Cylas formicarius TaxID=197179 RepID=UPI002958A531|nr:single-pass membrane and coiled-coil domain-containing protein 4 [Cylas formicarius]XP_060530777.1 single-pass membrane and coiled-coil domain-containing protein 4 [Cylas formicarius]XP_060530787.1 single-pass membrane and coiled-coil domain-containing protein 4 [Cylas formicarius]